ncbi:MAG: cytochrome c oxidase assembly protein [Dehalococcoidia bacterium]
MEWHAHPDAILMALLLLGLYAAGARWAGGKTVPRQQVTTAQAVLYVSGVATLYIGAGSPVHDISEKYLLSMHMFQHLLFTLVAPPLLLLGTPGWMLRPLIQNHRVRRVAYTITRPFPALAIFNGVVLVTHLIPVVDLALQVHMFHFFVHVLLVATAILMWFPVLSPLPELPRIGPFAQLIYLFVQQLVPGVVASFLVFADNVVYEFYASAPVRYWGISVVDDQKWAAVVMKLLGGTLLWAVMAVIFFRWFGEEDRATSARTRSAPRPGVPDVRWPEVEAELERMGLTKR